MAEEQITEKGNKILLKNQDRSIRENREVLELLATEKIESKEREREELLKEVDKIFSRIRKENWRDPEFVEAMERLED